MSTGESVPRPTTIKSQTHRRSDLDGRSDDFELFYFFNRFNSADAALESDGDTWSNLNEFLAGTNPLDPNSYFRITIIQRVGQDLHISFTSTLGKPYLLETRPGLFSGDWVDLDYPLDGNGSIMTFELVNEFGLTPPQFYRVKIKN